MTAQVEMLFCRLKVQSIIRVLEFCPAGYRQQLMCGVSEILLDDIANDDKVQMGNHNSRREVRGGGGG